MLNMAWQVMSSESRRRSGFIFRLYSRPPGLSSPVLGNPDSPPAPAWAGRAPASGAVVVTTKYPAAGPAASVPKVIEVATSGGGFRLINDNDLLALLADKPAVLIRTGPDSEELVFANPADQKTFQLY